MASVERALSIVTALETADQTLTLADLALRTGYCRSTILRLLGSLIAAGFRSCAGPQHLSYRAVR